jgi:hypothetical protein
MDFWIDLGIAAILRVLKDRREVKKWRPALIKVAAAINNAFADDDAFFDEVQVKAKPKTQQSMERN